MAIWRRAGFTVVGKHALPTTPAVVFRSAETGAERSLSWTPDRRYAEFYRTTGTSLDIDAVARRIASLKAGGADSADTTYADVAALHIWQATAPRSAILAVINHGPFIEYVIDPEMLEDLEELEPDPTLARQFLTEVDLRPDQFPSVIRDRQGRVYVRQGDAYHQVIRTPQLPDRAGASRPSGRRYIRNHMTHSESGCTPLNLHRAIVTYFATASTEPSRDSSESPDPSF